MGKELWGKTKDGEEMVVYELKDRSGKLRARFTNYGAILLSLFIPEKDGELRDVVLGFDEPEKYFDNPGYYGTLVARNANRIGGAHFTLNGKAYDLDKNDGNNNLHSGFNPLCKRIWQVSDYAEDSITFYYDSPAMDMGFPGKLHIDVTYTLRDNALIIDYHGLSDEDTVFNPTNHSYFNLKGAGNGDILDHKLLLHADRFTCTDAEAVPTGEVREVAGTPMDFRTAKEIGKDIEADYDQIGLGHGYDHNFVLSQDESLLVPKYAAHDLSIYHAATLLSPDEDVSIDVYTDRPGAQVYSGNFISGEEIGKGGKRIPYRGGIAIETQGYPNAWNVEDFPKPLIKADEDTYLRTVYQFSVK